MRENKKIKLIALGIFGICCLITLILIWNKISYLNENEIKQIDISFPQQIIKYCSEGDILEDANCVMEFISGFYKYNLSNLNKDLSFSELKEQGGVCWQWSELYCKIGKDLGYSSTILEFKTQKIDRYQLYHQVCVWADKYGYIIFDGENIFKSRFKEMDKEEFKKSIGGIL